MWTMSLHLHNLSLNQAAHISASSCWLQTKKQLNYFVSSYQEVEDGCDSTQSQNKPGQKGGIKSGAFPPAPNFFLF